MAKIQSPLLGYNTNVRHKGKVFHIQTEDSGIAKPHVITHLFADGGRIIKSVKTSYADKLDAPDLQNVVKKLMQEQHKAMFIALRDGVYDDQMEVTVRTAAIAVTVPATPATKDPPEATSSSPSDDSIELDESSFVEDLPPPGQKVAPAAAPPPPIPSNPAPSTMRSGPRQSAGWPHASARPPLGAPPSGPPPLRSQSGHATSTAPLGQPSSVATAPGSLVSPNARADKRTPAPTPRIGVVFGERLVSERSLDDVILAYLAEELGEKPAR